MSNTVLDWLPLETPPRVVFESPPLVLALCQVQYTPMLNVSAPAAVAPFQMAILNEYPMATQDQNVHIQMQGDFQAQQAAVQSSLGSVSWRFADTDDTWTVVLTPEFITLETRAYQDFDDFLRRLEQVLRALAKHIRPTVGLRIGLRYVNEIRPTQMNEMQLIHNDWASVIQSDLLGTLALPEWAHHTVQSVQQLHLRGPDNVGVTIHHGLAPGGTVVNPRPGIEPPEGPFYLLDFDVYQEFQPGVLRVKPGVIRAYVEQYHEVISRLFRWSVTESYSATLGRRDNVAS